MYHHCPAGFSLLVVFPLLGLEWFYSFSSTICVFIDFFKEFSHFSSIIFIKAVLRSLSYVSAMLEKSGSSVVEKLDSSDNILSWLLLIVFLC